MTDQADTGTTLCVPLSAVRDVLSDHLAPGLVDRSLAALTTVSLRLPTEGLEDLEPLLTDLEEFKAKLAQTLEKFEQAVTKFKAETEATVEKITRGPAPNLALLTEFVSLLGRRGVLPTEAHESLAGLLKLVTLRIRQLDDAIRVATAFKTTIDGAADDFRLAARGESNDEESDTDDEAEKLARAHLEVHLVDILWLLRRNALPDEEKTPLLACDPDQLPVYTQAAIRACVGRFYP